MAKESLSNVARHAAAERVSIILDGTAEVIQLGVKDFGIGFRTGSPGIDGGLGLLSMQQRVALLGGNLSIRSQPGRGTDVMVAVPLEAASPLFRALGSHLVSIVQKPFTPQILINTVDRLIGAAPPEATKTA